MSLDLTRDIFHQTEKLVLSGNDLTGLVPSELALLRNLDILQLYPNRNLTGPFTCPEFVELCEVSCRDLPECRVLE